jgi:hypothetical protein
MGLPEWDTVKLTLEGEEGLVGTQVRTNTYTQLLYLSESLFLS